MSKLASIRPFALSLCAFFLITSAYAQEDRITRNPWDKAEDFLFFRDAAERRVLAERIIAAREGSQPFAESYRRHLFFELSKLTIRELLEIERTGRLKETAIGDSNKDLVYTPVQPCRVIHTGEATLGILSAGSTRVFFLADHGPGFLTPQGGNPAGCGIPYGTATAVHINPVAVLPAAQGHFTMWPYDTAQPNAAAMNYHPAMPVLANGIIVPICNPSISSQCSQGDLNVFSYATTHLVVDVYGYFSRFPAEAKRSFAWNTHYETSTTIASQCTHHGNETSGTRLTITVPEIGKVFVEGTAVVQLNHTTGADDLIEVSIGTSSTDCPAAAAGATRHLVPSADATASNYQVSIPVSAVFSVDPSQSSTVSYFLNAKNLGSTSGADTFVSSRITATFHPN